MIDNVVFCEGFINIKNDGRVIARVYNSTFRSFELKEGEENFGERNYVLKVVTHTGTSGNKFSLLKFKSNHDKFHIIDDNIIRKIYGHIDISPNESIDIELNDLCPELTYISANVYTSNLKKLDLVNSEYHKTIIFGDDIVYKGYLPDSICVTFTKIENGGFNILVEGDNKIYIDMNAYPSSDEYKSDLRNDWKQTIVINTAQFYTLRLNSVLISMLNKINFRGHLRTK